MNKQTDHYYGYIIMGKTINAIILGLSEGVFAVKILFVPSK